MFMKNYKLIIVTFFIALGSMIKTCCAETCPSVNDIKKNNLHAWRLYDVEDNAPLTIKQISYFKKFAQQFTLAEWRQVDEKHGMIRCYYRDKNGSEARAYLTKNNFTPETSKNTWYSVSGSMHCAAGLNQCLFQQYTSSKTQFANNDRSQLTIKAVRNENE